MYEGNAHTSEVMAMSVLKESEAIFRLLNMEQGGQATL